MENRQPRSLLKAMFSLGTAAIVAGCSPLPGPSLDPLYLKGGTRPSEATAQAQPPASSQPSATTQAPRVEPKPGGTSMWTGRYQDSRGAGEVTFSLVRGVSTVSGTWRFRTGGGGPMTAVAEPGGRRFQLRMESTAPDCPGTFDGWMEIGETVLTGTYQGKDCEGPVSEGRLDLRQK